MGARSLKTLKSAGKAALFLAVTSLLTLLGMAHSWIRVEAPTAGGLQMDRRESCEGTVPSQTADSLSVGLALRYNLNALNGHGNASPGYAYRVRWPTVRAPAPVGGSDPPSATRHTATPSGELPYCRRATPTAAVSWRGTARHDRAKALENPAPFFGYPGLAATRERLKAKPDRRGTLIASGSGACSVRRSRR